MASSSPPAMQLFRRLAFLILLGSALAAADFLPLSESDKIAAKQLFQTPERGFGSLEKTYQAVRSLQVLGGIAPDDVTCLKTIETLVSSGNDLNQVFFALKVAEILNCQMEGDFLQDTVSKIVLSLKDASSLLDFYFSIGSLAAIKKLQWFLEDHLVLEDATNAFNAVKELGQTDGTWKYSAVDGESSVKAAGLALETFAGLISLSGSYFEKEKINQVSRVASKLFESIENYDDGTKFFHEKVADTANGGDGDVEASSAVVRGVAELAAVVDGHLKLPADKFVGLAHFFLSLGVPGSPDEAYYQLDALGYLERNSITIPLVVSLPYSVLSLSSKDLLEVSVTTVLGSDVPVSVRLVNITKVWPKGRPVLAHKGLVRDAESFFHKFDLMENRVDVGKYDLTFTVDHATDEYYSTGGAIKSKVLVTGVISFSSMEVRVVDSDTGSPEFVKKLDPSSNETVALFANHLQTFQLLLAVTSPFGEAFKPHQMFVKLKHESELEHLFLVESSGMQFELTLDFLGLLEKLYYLSGHYSVELVVGDAAMENSFVLSLGSIELDLPEPPEGASRGPAAVGSATIYGPKAEISHIFRTPEKRAPSKLSDTFSVLTVLPLLGFLVGLHTVGANVRSLPLSGLPMFAALCFHGGIAGILVLYFVFWLKLNLFTVLKYLGMIGIFLFFSGYHILSYLADLPSKVKTA